MANPRALDRFRPMLEEALRKRVGNGRLPLYDMLRYQMGWMDEHKGLSSYPGQRTHGGLALLTAEVMGADPATALPAAVAVEFIRGSLDIQEDLRLGSPGRDHRPALWWTFGHAQGINAGDGMLSLARVTLAEAEDLPAAQRLQALAMLDQACILAFEASYQEIEMARTGNWTADTYRDVLEGEYGAAMGAAAGVGAVVAGALEAQVKAVHAYGSSLGVARRLRLEIDTFARPGAEDKVMELLDKQRSLPLLYAMGAASADQLRTLQAVAARTEPIDEAKLSQIIAIVETSGALDQTEWLLKQYLRKAIETLGTESAVLEAVAREMAAADTVG